MRNIIGQPYANMVNSCGNTVGTTRTNQSHTCEQYTAIHTQVDSPEYKSSNFPPDCPHFFPTVTHSLLAYFTAVSEQLIPTIHTTNKNYKKFLYKKLLFIYPEVV